ncbi:MAG TPA: hypothetical protein PLF61_06230, partial [Candidatus Goldiibacteriota bacterium]|nr:hypothetical protein [Candidatus Goldiibacteriota bacterium]
LMPNDFLKIVYGTKENGGGGVQAPYAPGTYYFLMQEKPADASAFTPLDSQPSIEVMMIELTKSANVTSIMAKNTFTFTLTYKNISNMYPVNEVRIWDTLPPGLNFIGANITPAAQTEDYLSWNLGTLYYNMSGSLQIAVEAQPGIIEYGQKLTNTAKMEASDGYGTYREEAEISVNVLGVKLVSDLIAIPSSVVLDGYVTVLMNVLNQGNYSAYNVSPTALTIYGDGKVINVSGPLPASVSMLEQGMETNFTWIYKATGAGPVYFNGRALGQENYMVVESYATYSNTVGITIPTNTNTPVISFTSTPMHTKTFTKTQTPSSTETQQIAATPTFTITMTLEFTPTFTETSKPVIITPTSVKTMVPTPTPDAFVYVDRNYFNPEKGETVKINYKVSEQGIVDVKIHNLSGEMIFSYSKNYPYATYDYLYWDGKNSAGKTAGRGIYF